jgi:hypothetical protein
MDIERRQSSAAYYALAQVLSRVAASPWACGAKHPRFGRLHSSNKFQFDHLFMPPVIPKSNPAASPCVRPKAHAWAFTLLSDYTPHSHSYFTLYIHLIKLHIKINYIPQQGLCFFAKAFFTKKSYTHLH